jgi:hypothetical protein
LYSLYVMYLGLPVLMKNPKEKTIPYMVVLIIASIIGGVILSMVSRVFTPSMGSMMGGAGMRGSDATISTPMGEIKINKNADLNGTPGQATITTPAGNAVITTTPAAPGTPTDSATMTIQTPKGEVKIDMKNMEAMANGLRSQKQSFLINSGDTVLAGCAGLCYTCIYPLACTCIYPLACPP